MPFTPSDICVSLLPADISSLKSQLLQSAAADLIELRLDACPPLIYDITAEMLQKRTIFTLRSQSEGGKWSGSEPELIEYYKQALSLPFAFYDVEWSGQYPFLLNALNIPADKIILSHHTAEHDAPLLQNTLMQMLNSEAGIYKFIFTAADVTDNVTAEILRKLLRQKSKKYIVHAMGEAGKNSRIEGALDGNQLTFAALSAARETAGGQYSLRELNDIFNIKHQKPQVRRVGLIGNPVAQSSGWKLHNILQQRISAEHKTAAEFLYLNYPVKNLSHFWDVYKNKISGASITLPHKTGIIKYLDEKSDEVRSSGVCNTILKIEDKWHGYNTDFLAIEELLKENWDGRKSALIIGSGGTAQTSAAVLKANGIEMIHVLVRNKTAIQKIVEKFGIGVLTENSDPNLKFDIIVQTTPLGMYPNVHELPEGSQYFKSGTLVLDVIYNPQKTQFLALAEQRGCQIISGMEMFLRQARHQFQLFSGSKISLQDVKSVWEDIHAGN